MDLSASRDLVLSILNEEMDTHFDQIAPAMREWQRHERRPGWDSVPIGICGFACMGDCDNCNHALEELDAFFAPPAEPVPAPIVASASIEGSGSSHAEEHVEIQVFPYAGDEDRALENALSADAVEEMYRDHYYADDGYDEGYYEEEEYDDDDDGGGLDWNESGYFD